MARGIMMRNELSPLASNEFVGRRGETVKSDLGRRKRQVDRTAKQIPLAIDKACWNQRRHFRLGQLRYVRDRVGAAQGLRN